MSNYKSFNQQVADLFIQKLESGTSPLQGTTQNAFQTPVNASTGKNYRGLNALWLSMQPYEDPRWMTLNQANKMQIKIPKGSAGTMISIVKTSESFPMLDDSGKRMKDEQGKTKYQNVQLEQPVEETHWVFNAAQLAIAQDRKTPSGTESGTGRLNKFIAAAGIELVLHTQNVEGYDVGSDQIQVARDPGHYQNEEAYSAALLRQLASWTGHPERLNRDTTVKPGDDDYAAEQLKTGLATLLLSSEMGLSVQHSVQLEKFIPDWVTLIKSDPSVLSMAANEAQKIADYILTAESKLGLRKNIPQKPMPLDLAIGDEIKYGNTSYKVIEAMKGNKLKIEDLGNGAKMPVSPADGLYKSLVQAKYRDPGVAKEHSYEQRNWNEIPAEIKEEQSANRSFKR